MQETGAGNSKQDRRVLGKGGVQRRVAAERAADKRIAGVGGHRQSALRRRSWVIQETGA